MKNSQLTTKEKIEGFNTRFTIAGITDIIPNPVTGFKIGGGDEDQTEWISVPVIFQCFHKDLGDGEYSTRVHREPTCKYDVDKYNKENYMSVRRGGWGNKSFTVSTHSMFGSFMEHTIKYSDIQIITAIDNDGNECRFFTDDRVRKAV